MASSGAARPTMQRALQTCSSNSFNRTSLLVNHTQIRHATRATKAKLKAKAEAALANSGANAQQKPKPKVIVRHHPNRDHNKQRGLSVIRQTGPREYLSVSNVPLPRPVSVKDFPAVQVDASHGLWDFFYSKEKPLNTPKEDKAHGRAWTVEELRRKNWEELHSLWWVCIKERNRIATANVERKKGGYGYGVFESREREMEVRKTQNAIKHALTERFYAWEDAVELAKKDPEIRFEEDGTVTYTPSDENWEEAEEAPEWEEEDGIATEGKSVEDAEADKKTEHEAVDPSIPPAAGKTHQDGPRP